MNEPAERVNGHSNGRTAQGRAVNPHRHVVIVGTGFGGLGMAIHLKQHGFESFTVFERASDVGGTWRDNTYPGAACDVQSHLYSFSFEPNPKWTRMFAWQSEILDYLRHCAKKYGVQGHINFDAEVTAAVYDEREGLWEVRASDGTVVRARAIVSATGGLSRPSFPDIAGLSSFEGKTFHSARWDHGYDLAGKRVAVIGTGASSIQIVPEVAKAASQLFVMQRTPPWIMPKPDRAIGFGEQTLYARFPALQRLHRRAIFTMLDVRGVGFVWTPKVLQFAERISLAHLARQVKDRELRKKLAPNYRMGCKRILISNDYYPAIARENVSLVTTGIERVDAKGLVLTDGSRIDVDCIILSTGFQAAEHVAPYRVVGKKGVVLDEAWQDGAEAYLGTTVSGFPSFFMIVGPNTGLGHNSMVYMIESQIRYIATALDLLFARNLKGLDVLPDRQRAYNAKIHPRLDKAVWGTGCVSWYRTKSGKNTTLWPGFASEFRMRLRRFDVENYELAKA
jgi:cation diffusion facilitator CzcD-associated flavoprotein CzcO